MANTRLTAPSRECLSPAEWSSIVELYEIGEMNQRELAERFGVSSAAIQKGLKKRSAVKGRRVGEHPEILLLKRELRIQWRAKQAAEAAAFERMNQRTAFVAALTEMLLRADDNGTLADLRSCRPQAAFQRLSLRALTAAASGPTEEDVREPAHRLCPDSARGSEIFRRQPPG